MFRALPLILGFAFGCTTPIESVPPLVDARVPPTDGGSPSRDEGPPDPDSSSSMDAEMDLGLDGGSRDLALPPDARPLDGGSPEAAQTAAELFWQNTTALNPRQRLLNDLYGFNTCRNRCYPR